MLNQAMLFPGHMLHHVNIGLTVKHCVHQIPSIMMEASIQPITRTVLRVRLFVTPDFHWNDQVNMWLHCNIILDNILILILKILHFQDMFVSLQLFTLHPRFLGALLQHKKWNHSKVNRSWYNSEYFIISAYLLLHPERFLAQFPQNLHPPIWLNSKYGQLQQLESTLCNVGGTDS